MTNVPTAYDLIEFFILPLITPFTISFLIYYMRYRNIKKGFITGIFSIQLLIILLIPFMTLNWDHLGLVSGILAGMIGLFAYPTSNKGKLTIEEIRNMNKKQVMFVAIAALLLITPTIYGYYSNNRLEFSIEDPENDLSYSGYSTIVETEKKGIDITGMSSRIEDDNIVLEMQLADGALTEDAEYRFYISTQKDYLWSMTLDAKRDENDSKTLQATIPLSSIEDRKIFHVLATASVYDGTRDLDLHDTCENWKTFM